MSEEILKTRVYKDSRTVKIMEEFESQDDNLKKKYSSLELCDIFCIKYRRKLYWVSLIIQRKPKGQKCTQSSLTFTDLKKLLDQVFTLADEGSYKIVSELFKEIKRNWQCESNDIEVVFPIPVQFNAQNSSNRSGYGNRYCGEELVYEGTLYGETTDYMFVGAKYRRWQ